MNIMFVVGKERTREIGIRKAIALKDGRYSTVLYESAIICLIGGMIGLVFAIILSKIINQIPADFQYRQMHSFLQ